MSVDKNMEHSGSDLRYTAQTFRQLGLDLCLEVSAKIGRQRDAFTKHAEL